MKGITRKSVIEKTAVLIAAMGLPAIFLKKLNARVNSVPLQRVMNLEAMPESDGSWVLEIPGCKNGEKYFYLNSSAREVWELIDATNTTGDIAAIISERYSISGADALEAVQTLVSSMREHHLVI